MPGIARAEGLTKSYTDTTVVNKVSFTVNAGEIVVLVGPNGSGKTTTMEMLVGLRRPSAGTATISGIPVRPGGPHRLKVGVQLQQSGLPHRLRVGEALRSVGSLYRDPEDPRAILKAVGLEGTWRSSVDRISGGQQRRLDVGLACMGRPDLLVLDEPTSGLDPEGRSELWQLLRSMAGLRRGIFASTHDLNEAEGYADRVLVMKNGRIVLSGGVRDVLASFGGAWRLRILTTHPGIAGVLDRSKLRYVVSGAVMVSVGSETECEAVRARLFADGLVTPTSVFSGPIRLEDLFLFIDESTVIP